MDFPTSIDLCPKTSATTVKKTDRLTLASRTVDLNATALVVMTLTFIAAFCLLLRETATLRLEAEELRMRLSYVEQMIDRCDSFLEDDIQNEDQWSEVKAVEDDGVNKDADEDHLATEIQSLVPQVAPSLSQMLSPSLSSSTSSSLSSLGLSSLSSLSTSFPTSNEDERFKRRRKRRNAGKKNPVKDNGKRKPKTNSKKEFAFSLEAEQPTACQLSECSSLIGWAPSSWVDATIRQHYDRLNGRLTIQDDGLYYIYAQVTYRTVSPLEAFAIMVGSAKVALCLTGVDYVRQDQTFEHNAKMKTCHTSTLAILNKGQVVWLNSMHMGDKVYTVSMANSNFWGLVRIPGK